MSASMLRVGNASGFLGDRAVAMTEMLTGGELDVLTGDYLAELTMLILGRQRAKDPTRGYATSYLRQLETGLGEATARGVRLVANAGGLDPAALAAAVRELAERLGLVVRVAHVHGDDLLPRAAELGFAGVLTANAYLGAAGIAACLREGADVVVTGRVTDASLVVGPAMAHFGWGAGDHHAIAGAMVAGHIIECGTQATGGNYAFASRHDVRHPGFPLVEVAADGSCTVTKQPGTGGAVTVGTVTAQLLYEIDGARYAGPDATARFDTIRLAATGTDRISVSGAVGEPPPPTTKVATTRLDGWRNEVTVTLTGLEVAAKAALVREQVEAALDPRPASVRWTLARVDVPDAETEQQATALLRCRVADADPEVVGRRFSGAAVELALASVAGFSLLAPPGPAVPEPRYASASVGNDVPRHVAALPDGTEVVLPPPAVTRALVAVPEPELPAPPPPGPTRRVPLGVLVGARSGDKGGDANIGVWVESDDAYAWLVHTLTPARVQELLPETAGLVVRRTVLPQLRAVNLVAEGLLGSGVASAWRFDPQAKGLGEWLRSRHIDIPEALLEDRR